MNIAKTKKSLLRFGKYILAAVVLVCMIFAFVNTHRLNRSIDEGNRKIILNYTNQVAYRLHDMFERVDISLNELSSELEKTDDYLTQEELLEQLKHYDETWSMDASGLMYENGENRLSDGTPVLLESEISLQDVLSYSEQLNISRQNINGEVMLVFAKPCRTQVGGQMVSGIFTAIKLERLEEFLGDYGYGEGSFLAVAQSDGNNIWRQGEELPYGTGNCLLDLEQMDVSRQDSVLQMKTRMSVAMDGTISYERDAQKYYMAYVPLSVNYWYLLVSARSDSIDLTELSQQHFLISALLVAAILVMGLIGIIYLFQRNRSISRHNEQLRIATEQANQANAAKRDFLAKVSHEIRTPLNGVMGMISLAQKDYVKQDKCLEHLEKAADSAQYLLALINDVLDMSQIESGKQKLTEETVDMDMLLGEVRTYLETDVLEKGISIEISTAALQHRYFRGDYLRIKQILINLTTNAVKYTPPEGRIRLEIDEMGDDSSQQVIFRIEDNGEGIAPEQKEEIFKPFEQASRRHKGGVGLGLSIVRSFVELMGGRIVVESEPGKGSTFTVTLPLPAAEPPGDSLEEEKADLKGITILLAEDNEINAEIALALLESMGAGVILARDGDEAVKAFQEAAPGTYQVILMDIQMPKMNGIEAAKAIRGLDHPDAAGILIFAVTANAFKEQKDEILRAGMNECMYKPIDIEKVCACIRRWIHEE
ncbi:hybrid sensor histidine kinase/response regulator [Extibacter muris]|nr:ATP-binding protein [Extibacter muris]MCB6201632.1 response regulator [Extibacter muris]MCQ4662958.1 ATP-binding protein [Extibacter muris]MCQ4693224.1 ATP-binding protein [Extibacter muris]